MLSQPLLDTLYYDRLKGGNAWMTHSYQPGEQEQFVSYYTQKTGQSPLPLSEDPAYKSLQERATAAAMSGNTAEATRLTQQSDARRAQLMGTGTAAFPSLFGTGPVASPVTQADLIRAATRALSPAGRAVLTEQSIAPMQFGGPRPVGFQPVADVALPDQLRQATARQLGSLDKAEQGNLGTLLVNKYNVGFDEYAAQAKKQSMGQGFTPASRLLGYRL